MSPFDTHAPVNLPQPFEGVNLFTCDAALREAVEREGAGWAAGDLAALGARLGEPATLELGRLANANPPRLVQYDRAGRRIDELEFHPAWHTLMQMMIEQGVHASPWEGGQQGRQVARAARFFLFGQVENGSQCPVTMTYACVPALRHAAPALAEHWLPRILSRRYDPRSLPVEQKQGALVGMGMTEKQGGTDVRANTTRATPMAAAEAQARFGAMGEGAHTLVGHKWFFSAPQADAHLVTAQTGEGDGALGCFFVPRYLPDGSRNAIRVQRLKDKLGNRSNASSEVEFCGAIGWPVGAAGRGIPTILEMASHTRLDCVVGSAGIMRAALTHAIHHARTRSAFGRKLSGHALMQNVLADLALESEAATAFALRLARCFDRADYPAETLLARVLTPAGKYWICKRGPAFGAEAMEVLGGNGYVEDGPLARMYREFPVNSIWEGSGNVMCLDVLRAFAKAPAAADALAAELAPAAGMDRAYDLHCERLLADLGGAGEYAARDLAERMVVAVQAGLLLRHAPDVVSRAFVASRLARPAGGAFGALPAGVDAAALIDRALS
ncbi:MAG TPA: isovaleryl-CoA dehydrogenase [Telluria sp.]